MNRAIITYAEGAHEELLDVAMPGFQAFADKHRYDMHVGKRLIHDLPPAWNKIPLLIDALKRYEEVIWFDCDLIIVNNMNDFPPIAEDKLFSMVRHFEGGSEIPNSGVWRLRRRCNGASAIDLLQRIMHLEVFTNHGWWEQAALMTLMGYSVPAQNSDYMKTKCRNVVATSWYNNCQFMRLCWNSHPNYRAERPRIVHCSYPDMAQRLEVMRALVKDPYFEYPRYEHCDHCKRRRPADNADTDDEGDKKRDQ